jgi:hypothetical protein
MFNKNLKDEITELKRDAGIAEIVIENLSKRNVALMRNFNSIGEIAEDAIQSLKDTEESKKAMTERVEALSKEMEEFTEFKRHVLNGGNILKKWMQYTFLPDSCNAKLELTNRGFNVTFSSNNLNRSKFPEMMFIVYEGNYGLESKIEMKPLENEILNDIFIHLLENNMSLKESFFAWEDRIEISSKKYSHKDTQVFIEDVVEVYRLAYSQYRKIIEK